MRTRNIYASIGFMIGLSVALLLGFLLQADSGNTYQIYRYGQVGEIFTASSSPIITAVLILIFSGIGLLIGYASGTKVDVVSLAGKDPVPSWRWDFGLIALLALISGFVLRNGAIDMTQLVLVALAVAFGPGTGLLSGISGRVFGIIIATIILSARLPFYSGLYGGGWYLLVLATFGGLEGALIGWLAKRARPAGLVSAIIVATIIGFLQALLLLGIANMASSKWLIEIRTLIISAVSGLLIGMLVRNVRPRWTQVVKGEDIKRAERTSWRR